MSPLVTETSLTLCPIDAHNAAVPPLLYSASSGWAPKQMMFSGSSASCAASGGKAKPIIANRAKPHRIDKFIKDSQKTRGDRKRRGERDSLQLVQLDVLEADFHVVAGVQLQTDRAFVVDRHAGVVDERFAVQKRLNPFAGQYDAKVVPIA